MDAKQIATGYPYAIPSGPPTEWSTSLCSCCDDTTNCCLTLWCPCVTFGQIAEIVDEGSTSCCVSGGIYGALFLLTGFTCCFYSCLYRTKMRNKFNLSDMPSADCVVHSFCEPCALCQEYRELKRRGYRPDLGWTETLQRQQNMTAPVRSTMAR